MNTLQTFKLWLEPDRDIPFQFVGEVLGQIGVGAFVVGVDGDRAPLGHGFQARSRASASTAAAKASRV